MTNPIAIPLIMTSAGPQPTPPLTLRNAVEQSVAAVVPDYTANLPGTLIEDVLSTQMGALVTMDQARVDSVDSVSPAQASPTIIQAQGAMFGIAQGTANNASVYVQFSGLSGAVIPSGTLVSDGTNQYAIQTAAVIGSTGVASVVLAVATTYGTWAIPANSVTTIVTSLPTSFNATVTNPATGTPATTAQTVEGYRGTIFGAFNQVAQGVASYIKQQLNFVPGVNPLLTSVQQVVGGWKVICAGGDPVAMAGAIYLSVLDLGTIVGSSDSAINVTEAILDGPNSYDVTFVTPVQNVVTMSVLWQTNILNFGAGSTVNALATPALVAYINSLGTNQPINLGVAQQVFTTAVSSALPAAALSGIAFTVNINDVQTPPGAGLQIIPPLTSDGYFYCTPTGVSVAQS